MFPAPSSRAARAVTPPPPSPSAVAPSTRPARRGEIRALTGLRIVAALWVLAFHLQGALAPAYQAFLQPVWPLIRAGWLGVDLFFVLSGFVMALTYVETMGPRPSLRDFGVFLWARLCRIWPLWALLTCLFAGWLAWSGVDEGMPAEQARHVNPLTLLEQLAMVQMWHRESLWGSTFVLPGWSLSVEFLAYVAFPLVVLVLYRLRRLPAVVLGALAVAAMLPLALQAYQTGMADFEYNWVLRIAGAFVSGGLVYLFVRKAETTVFWPRVSPFLALMALVEIVAVCWWASWRASVSEGDFNGVAVVVFPVLVAALAMSQSGVARLLSKETMVMGGRISFALYLVHSCVFEVSHDLSTRIDSYAMGSPLWVAVQPQLVLLSLGLAYLLWRFVEEPARRWMRRIGPGAPNRRNASQAGHEAPVVPLRLAEPVTAEPAAEVSPSAPAPRRPADGLPTGQPAARRVGADSVPAPATGQPRRTAATASPVPVPVSSGRHTGAVHAPMTVPFRSPAADDRPSRPDATR